MNPKRSSPRASELSLLSRSGAVAGGSGSSSCSTHPTVGTTGGCINNRWTLLNLFGLALNLFIFGLTLVLYHRMLDATSCLPDDNGGGPPVMIANPAAAGEEAKVERLELSPDNLKNNDADTRKTQQDDATTHQKEEEEESTQQKQKLPPPKLPPQKYSIGKTVIKEFPPYGFYQGTIQTYNKGEYSIVYEDGDKEKLDQYELDRIFMRMREEEEKKTMLSGTTLPDPPTSIMKNTNKKRFAVPQSAKEERDQKMFNNNNPGHHHDHQSAATTKNDAAALEVEGIALPQRDPDRDMHIIFSTGCGPKQNWQAYVLYHSIMESDQIGHVTRIASGCNEKEAIDINHIHKTQIEPMGVRSGGPGAGSSSSSRFHLHLTPEFGYPPENLAKTGSTRFMYMNKPYGVAHWLENVLGYSAEKTTTSHDHTIIMLLDPDMVILRPIVNDFRTNEVWRQRLSYPQSRNVYSVRHGFPMSQEYGYGLWWYNGIDVRDVLPNNELPSPVQNMTKKQLVENYTSGPPYIATASDFYKIVSKWRQIAWPVQRKFPDNILAEMFSYSWAAAHLNLPHQQAHSFMVSAHFEAGFQLFKRNKDIMSKHMCLGNIPTEYKPHILHYCQRYAIGKYILGKHRLPQGFVGHHNVTKVCQSPLLAEPPTNISTIYDYYIDPDDSKRYVMKAAKNGAFTSQEHVDRITFMLCEMIGALNRAATYFKKQHCNIGQQQQQPANYEKSLFFHQSWEISQEEFQNLANQ